MTSGQLSMPVFQSLESFWPGVLVSYSSLKFLTAD